MADVKTETQEKKPQIIGAMLETHAGYYAPGKDDTFEVGSILIDPQLGHYLKTPLGWEILSGGDARAANLIAKKETK